MTNIVYLDKGEKVEQEFPGLLEALQFVKASKIVGAWFKQFETSEWESVDNFMEAGRAMFAPVEEE